MAANGASVADIGSVAALTALPWSLKLVNGFFMDRYTFLAMGRRRVWIIGSQALMITLLIGAAIVQPEVGDVALLGAMGFIVNMATTFQDVAVDGLAVDIMEEDERARGSGMMFGGQAIGISLATTLTGIAIARLGPSAAYLSAAAFILIITTYVVALREREGERRLPWTVGVAHQRNLGIQHEAWWPIIRDTFKSLLLPISLLWLPVLLVRGFHYGVFTVVTPVLGAGEVGWDEESITSLVGSAQLIGGLLGLTLGGWLGDKFGAKRTTIGLFIAYMTLSAVMFATQHVWGDPNLFRSFVFVWCALDTLITVAALPISMRLCHPSVAATQFTIYMACSNFGISIGAWIFSMSEQLGGLRTMFAIVFLMHGIGLITMLLVKFPRRPGVPAEVIEQVAEAPGPRPGIS